MDESQFWLNRDGYEFELKQQRMAFEIECGCLQNEILKQQLRPSVIWKPTLYRRRPEVMLDREFIPLWKDFSWCVLHGKSLLEGISGFGYSPEEAMLDFDKQWMKKING